METKYYMAHNAGREIAGQRFEITEIFAGTAIGVFNTSDPALIKSIDEIVSKKSGVEQISRGEYDNAVKKKASSLISLPHSNPFIPQVRLSPVAGVVVPEGIQEDLTEATRLETVEGALESIDRVEPPALVEEPVVKPKKK